MSRWLPPGKLGELGLKTGRVFQRITDPVLLYVARIRIAGRATRRLVPVQTWLGGDRWGKVRRVSAQQFLGANAWQPLSERRP